MTRYRSAGFVWNAQTPDCFLRNPAAMVPGTTMGYAGIADAGERADLIAWLSQATRACTSQRCARPVAQAVAGRALPWRKPDPTERRTPQSPLRHRRLARRTGCHRMRKASSMLAARSIFHLFSTISQGMFLVDRSGRIV